VRPDLLLAAKGITSGYLPLGAVIASQRVWDPFRADDLLFRHGYTYSGHAAACAAANANLDIVEDEQLLARVQKLEHVLSASLAPVAAHEMVREIRSAGLLAAVQFVDPDPLFAHRLVMLMRDEGVLLRSLPGGALQLSPPFVITEEQLGAVADALLAALDRAATSAA
jgi:adenosylmethionine-8-amino-7-oxononanoate aminotransferase